MMIMLTNRVILGPIYVASGPLALRGFCNIFLPIIVEDLKKILPSERWTLALYHMVNPALVIALRS